MRIPYSRCQKVIESHEFWSLPLELIESQGCPYLDYVYCAIWKYRENLCVTYFCSSIGGVTVQTFLGEINKYLKMSETSLS